ncbi:MAG: DNA-binding response regulator [Candidatus Dactylopiibacterium carminicum]|uniref:DNA-binding response regulator n=1 Tax=Candidatus Dactylopiibacterium carminicum TaxID=857335 RepID=A0A272EUR7_9RHOO|nr:response regulator transcription factor [Candidatus Dactylopiibacterium carminicum]KAF7600375.1 DNA-binding response regulator [Candidatus Dactylopiibacterium carminicum]PAS93796.1 MAG: DNA-binding response regulator [Candidatus Dactylopiibacterium carminicum]PAS96834.1 MAG: DNA-binding response regulator [Candidatus Dactylopiibacterium carminicum]PAT00375.1 MAG: DNA-binding response regulator [Candidatus Dactylopiibacterium carminicum]
MRIVVLEDNLTQSTLVTAWLRNAGHDVHEFALTRELQRFSSRESVDLYLLDWMMPDISGEAFLRWLRNERNDETPAIFITSRDSEDDIVNGLAAGADDFIVKPVSQRVLLSRIEAVIRRSKPRDPIAPLDLPPYLIDPEHKRITLNGQEVELTEKEFDLAVFMFRNLGRLLSRGHLLEAVWGRNPDLATRTVDTHVSRVRGKLQLKPENGFRLVPTYNFGYRLERAENETESNVA